MHAGERIASDHSNSIRTNKRCRQYENILATLTLQLLSSSAVKIMTPHFFPGIPLRAKGERVRDRNSGREGG